MDSDQSSDADKTGKMLDPSDNNPERSNIPLDPDNNEDIADLAACVQDVPVSTCESNKGGEDPDTSKNMALCTDILKNFISNNSDKFQVNESSIPGQSDQHVSSILGSHQKNMSFLDALLDKVDPKEQQSKPIEGLPDFLNKKSVDFVETPDHGQTNVSPLDVVGTGDSMDQSNDSNARSATKRKQFVSDSISCKDSETTMAHLKSMKEREAAMKAKLKIETGCLQSKRAVPEIVACLSKPINTSQSKPKPKPKGGTECDPKYETPHYDQFRKLSSAGQRAPKDLFRKARQEFERSGQVKKLNEERDKLLTALTHKRKVLETIEYNLLQIDAPLNLMDNNVRFNVLKPNVREANPFDLNDPPAPYEVTYLSHYLSKEFIESEIYPIPPPPDSLDGSGADDNDDNGDDNDDDESDDDADDDGLSSSEQESSSGEGIVNISLDDEGMKVDHQALSVEKGIGVEPPSSESTVSLSSDTDNDFSVDGRKHKNLMRETRKDKIDSQGESDDDSPKYTLKKVPLVLDSAVSTFRSTNDSDNGSPVLKKKIPAHHGGGKSGQAQKSAWP